MQKEIEINQKKITYTLRRSHRARRMRLTINCEGSLTVTLPNSFFFGEKSAEKAIKEKANWILDKLEYFEKHRPKFFWKGSKKEFFGLKKTAEKLVAEKIRHFNQFYSFDFQKISIRNQKTRWGSCSKSGNLNFNYKIVFLPEKLADYIIVNELCHLGEFNHSPKFWNLVAKTIPEHKKIRKEIRGI